MFELPFTRADFFGVFAAYNEAVWPAQLVLIAGAVAAVSAALRRHPRSGRWIPAFLATLWAWTALAYHISHFSTINPAARAFGGLFVMQAAAFFWWGVVRGRLTFEPVSRLHTALGMLVLAYALVIYPILGLLAGQPWMASPTFGAPCPAVIFTFGMLLLARTVPLPLLFVPLLWAAIGSSAVLALGVYQDVGLLVSALLCVALRPGRARRAHRTARPSDPAGRRPPPPTRKRIPIDSPSS